jgi:NAD(P)-dependent dehydrogenase (short-subunit alcohol dehydrogenase family)
MLLQDKVVIVTGAGGGLGAGIARVCAREGAKVIVADVRGDAAQDVAGSLPGAMGVACDLRIDAALDALVAVTVEQYGHIDGLVNNAGANFSKPFLETSEEDWDWVMSLDLRAIFFLTQKVCRQMLAQGGGGSVVNISSVHSQSCLPGAGPYDAAKWGVVGMGKSMAVELAPQGIRVNAISPGLLNTQIWQDLQSAAPSPEACLEYWQQNIPIGRVIEPEEIGELAAFLLCDRSGSITGANMFADGGMTSQLVSREPFESKAIEGR